MTSTSAVAMATGSPWSPRRRSRLGRPTTSTRRSCWRRWPPPWARRRTPVPTRRWRHGLPPPTTPGTSTRKRMTIPAARRPRRSCRSPLASPRLTGGGRGREAVEDITKRRYHLTTGFLGTPYINPCSPRPGTTGCLPPGGARHLSLVGLHGAQGRHHHLGAVEQRQGRPGDEQPQPLRLGRRRPVVLRGSGRHQSGLARVQADPHSASPGRRPHLGEGKFPVGLRPDHQRVAFARRRTAPQRAHPRQHHRPRFGAAPGPAGGHRLRGRPGTGARREGGGPVLFLAERSRLRRPGG